MIMDPSPEISTTRAQSIEPQHLQPSLSQNSSGLEVFDYGVADQSGLRSEDRQDSSDVQDPGIADPKVSSDIVSVRQEELHPTNDQPEVEAQSRRSSSQEQNAESQYSPISVAPVIGQICR